VYLSTVNKSPTTHDLADLSQVGSTLAQVAAPVKVQEPSWTALPLDLPAGAWMKPSELANVPSIRSPVPTTFRALSYLVSAAVFAR